MTDDLKKRGEQDRARVNINEAHEVQYWTCEPGVFEAQLKAAVQAVGVSADAIRRHLAKTAR